MDGKSILKEMLTAVNFLVVKVYKAENAILFLELNLNILG